jgi:hypothetical protein
MSAEMSEKRDTVGTGAIVATVKIALLATVGSLRCGDTRQSGDESLAEEKSRKSVIDFSAPASRNASDSANLPVRARTRRIRNTRRLLQVTMNDGK